MIEVYVESLNAETHDDAVIKEALLDLFGRVRALEDSAMKRTEKVLDKPEGHPIPNYDKEALGADNWRFKEYDTEQCTKLFKAVFSDRVEEIEEAQMALIDATLDYLDHADTLNLNQNYCREEEAREWGVTNYNLYNKMKEAADRLNNL